MLQGSQHNRESLSRNSDERLGDPSAMVILAWIMRGGLADVA